MLAFFFLPGFVVEVVTARFRDMLKIFRDCMEIRMASAGFLEGYDTVRLGRMQVCHPVISLCPRADP